MLLSDHELRVAGSTPLLARLMFGKRVAQYHSVCMFV
jgi:hypothetical protein